MYLADLCHSMDVLARDTWRKLEGAAKWGLVVGEPAITAMLVLGLAQARAKLSVPLMIRQITPRHEHSTGADVELWLKLGNCDRYLGYSCQSKIVSPPPPAFEYPHILYPDKQGPLGSATRQYKVLIDHATKVGSIPVHLLYNGWDYGTSRDLDGSAFDTTKSAYQKFGCAAMSTVAVEHLLDRGAKRTTQFAPFLFPWSWLFREWGWVNASSDGTGAKRVRGTDMDTDDCLPIARVVASVGTQHGDSSTPQMTYAPRVSLDHLPREVPWYVNWALEATKSDVVAAEDQPIGAELPQYLVMVGFESRD